jgi:hypothetical protein
VKPPRTYLIRCLLAALALSSLLAIPTAAEGKGEFRSAVRTIRPAVPGLELAVVHGDRRLTLRNETGRTVVVRGYDDEPYLRFQPDGKVERNTRSPATYLNADRYGGQPVPPGATPGVTPRWKAVADNGTFTWFDHRIHLTTKRPPGTIVNSSKPKKIFDWEVPLTVDGRRAQALGTLSFDPGSSSGGFPAWLAVLIGVAVVLGGIALVVLARRRSRPEDSDTPDRNAPREAW